jgi:hypothetical protein
VALAAGQWEQLAADGYTLVPDFLDAAEIESLGQLCASLDAPLHRAPFGVSIRSDDLAYRATVDRGIKAAFAAPLARLLPGYRHCFSNFLVKAPAAPERQAEGSVPLHIDISVTDESEREPLALWVPLVDTNKENGCLCVVPGSHKLIVSPRWVGSTFPFAGLAPALQARLRPLEVAAGTAILYRLSLIHASPPNRTGASRPVAGVLIAPEPAQLLCYCEDRERPGRLRVYAVDDLFYTRYDYGSEPAGVPLLRTEPARRDVLDLARLEALIPAAAAGSAPARTPLRRWMRGVRRRLRGR